MDHRISLSPWTLIVAFVLALGPLSAQDEPAADWPQWRGPNRDGLADRFPAVDRWPEKLAETWKVEVGEGHSSPVVAAGTVFILSRQGDDEVVRALKVGDGKELWRQSYPAPYTMDSAAKDHGKGPKATPAVSGSVVFTLGISGILSAFGAESGAPRWRHDFTKEFPRTSPLYGSAASPLVSGQLCIVPIGGHDRGALRAFDAKTGEPRWSWNEDGPAYSSPVVGTLGGKRQVVVQMQNYILGVEAQSGTFLWKKPFRTAYDQNIVTPIILDDLVIHSGYQQPIEALRLRSEEGGQKLSVETAWQDKADSQFMSSAVTTEGLLFAHSHRQRGRILCRQARDGKLLWRGPERFGEQASLVLAGGFLLALNTEGVLTVLRAHDKGYEEVRKYDVADTPTWAHIAVAGRTLLVKDRNSLACLRIQ